MLKAFLTTTLLKWLARRGLEPGGLLTVMASIDPMILNTILQTLGALLSGNWSEINLGALVGLIGTLGGLIWNWRSTFGSHVVVQGVRVDKKDLPGSTQVAVEQVAKSVVAEKQNEGKTIFERLFRR